MGIFTEKSPYVTEDNVDTVVSGSVDEQGLATEVYVDTVVSGIDTDSNLDGGSAISIYGGTTGINGGIATTTY